MCCNVDMSIWFHGGVLTVINMRSPHVVRHYTSTCCKRDKYQKRCPASFVLRRALAFTNPACLESTERDMPRQKRQPQPKPKRQARSARPKRPTRPARPTRPRRPARPADSAVRPRRPPTNKKQVTSTTATPPSCLSTDRGTVRASNEDRIQVEPLTCRWHLGGVYDGHGGAQVADYLRKHMASVMHKVVAQQCAKDGERGRGRAAASPSVSTTVMRRAIVQALKRVDADMQHVFCGGGGRRGSDRSACNNAGSTCSIVLWRRPYAVFANIGDSRAVLVEHPTGRVMFSTVDQKPDLKAERAAIERRGGRVSRATRNDVARVNDQLAMSRALGDWPLKPAVSNEAAVTTVRVNRPCAVIIASDGLWDVMSSAEVGRIYQSFVQRNKGPAGFCDQLIKRALTNNASAGVCTGLGLGRQRERAVDEARVSE